MPEKKKKRDEEELPEEGLPEEEAPEEGADQDVSADMDAKWQNVESVVQAAKDAYLGGSNFSEVIASLIETLQTMQAEETEGLGGLGVGAPGLVLPPEAAEGGAPPEEE